MDNPHAPWLISTVGDMTHLRRFFLPAVALVLAVVFAARAGFDPVFLLTVLLLLLVFVVPLLLLLRTGTRFAAGPPPELAGASWSTTVTIHEGAGQSVPLGGVLGVWPDRIAFLPSDKAARKGRTAWHLTAEQLEGVEVRRAWAGAWIIVYSRGGPNPVFACWRWQGCAEAVAALGVPVR